MLELDSALAAKRDRLLELLQSAGRVAVAFSAGVDSTMLAKAACLACGDRAVAVTAVSPSLAGGERAAAEQLAREIGIRHVIVETDEFRDPDYIRNAPNRCYFCKTELYNQIERLMPELAVDVVLNGATIDDLGDYRPGLQAADEHRVRSPLVEAGFTKDDVRGLARFWELPVWDKPASPCLASRIAYGLAVTPERVRRVDLAESFLREELGLRELRVRYEANDLARIELPLSALPQIAEPALRARITGELHRLGFRYVALDLDGFRSGSMNAVVPLETLTRSVSS